MLAMVFGGLGWGSVVEVRAGPNCAAFSWNINPIGGSPQGAAGSQEHLDAIMNAIATLESVSISEDNGVLCICGLPILPECDWVDQAQWNAFFDVIHYAVTQWNLNQNQGQMQDHIDTYLPQQSVKSVCNPCNPLNYRLLLIQNLGLYPFWSLFGQDFAVGFSGIWYRPPQVITSQ
jgi:hypothetical protein